MKKLIFRIPLLFVLSVFLFYSCTSTSESTENNVSAEVVEDQSAVQRPGEMSDDADIADNSDASYGLFNEVEETEEYDLLSLARMEEDLSKFVDLVELSGLDASLMMTEPVTVFMPTNEAFEEMPKERYDYLTDPQNKVELVKLIQAHILPNEVSTSTFENNQIIETSNGENITVSTSAAGDLVTVGGVNIVNGDIKASNGTIHVVDGVFTPEATDDVGVGPY